MSSRISELKLALRGVRANLRESVPLAPLTHLRIGGPAELFVEPVTEEDAARVIGAAHETGVPLYVLGGGSNLVVADRGVQGAVLSLVQLNRVVRDGLRVTAGAGASLPALIRNTKDLGLAGLESLTGIPAMVGGAVAMNAGTRTGETFDHLEALVVAEPSGELRTLARSELAPRYRDGGLAGRVALQASFALREDDPAAIFARIDEWLRRRKATQPVSERSVGCVFQNPDGDAAGRLIEAAGMKLHHRGGISVSALHANYFVNDGTGTSADFEGLVRDVREAVRAKTGIELQTEVKFWGFEAGAIGR